MVPDMTSNFGLHPRHCDILIPVYIFIFNKQPNSLGLECTCRPIFVGCGSKDQISQVLLCCSGLLCFYATKSLT